MKKFLISIGIVGVLALWPVVMLVSTVVKGQSGYVDTESVIIISALVYIAVGVVIVAPAWVIQQIIIILIKHAIMQVFTPKHRR